MTTDPNSEPGHDPNAVDPNAVDPNGIDPDGIDPASAAPADEPSSPAATADGSTSVIDRFSLEQALLDAEIATTRAHDLALRLVELRAELEAERSAHAALIARAEHAERLYDEIVHNRAYGLATKVWTARRLLGG